MAKSSLIILERKKVYTVSSSLLIKSSNWKPLLESLKKRYPNIDEIKNACSVFTAVKHFGWNFRRNASGINRLIYNDDCWTLNAMLSISQIAKFVEDGGYTDIYNSKYQTCFSYRFSNGKAIRTELSVQYLNPSNESQMKELLQNTINNLLNLNVSHDEIQSLVSEQVLANLFSR